MAIKVGTSAPDTFYVGASAVDKVYQGANLVWAASTEPPPTSLLVSAVSCSEYNDLSLNFAGDELFSINRTNWANYGPLSNSGGAVINPDGDTSPISMPVGATQIRFQYAKGGSVVPNSRIEVYMGRRGASGPKVGTWYIPAATGGWATWAWSVPVSLDTPVPSGYDAFWILFEADDYSDVLNLRSLEFVA